MLSSGFTFYNNVVNVDFHGSTDQGLEDFFHYSLISSTVILKSERHDFVVVQPIWCNKVVFSLSGWNIGI